MKGVIPFHGVAMAMNRKIVADALQGAEPLSAERSIALARELMVGTFAEEKLAGVLILTEHAPGLNAGQLPQMRKLLDDGLLQDWNSVDWFAVKVLGGQLLKNHGLEVAQELATWASSGLWTRRAATVAFVMDPKPELYMDALLTLCGENVKDATRWSQTCVGWALRTMGQNGGKARVEEWVADNKSKLSDEAINMALASKKDGRARKRQKN